MDYLRAIACLIVVFGHVYLMGYNGLPEISPWVPSVKSLIFGPDAAQRNVFTAPLTTLALSTGINVGALGVGIFFLISGFVILRAVERESSGQFIVRRAFRIYPVCAVAVGVAAGTTAFYCSVSGTESPHTLKSVLGSVFILNGFLHGFETTPVLWSLEVEIFFYILMAALARLSNLDFAAILKASLACMGFTLLVNAPSLSAWIWPPMLELLRHLSFATLQITFLFVGSMLYRTATNGVSIRAVMYIVASIAVFTATRTVFPVERGADSGGVDIPNGFWALIVFSIAFWSGMNWKWIRPLRWFADISYPLYLVHVPLAWICFAWLADYGWGMAPAGVATGIIIVLTAWLIHITVETRAQKLGRLVANRLFTDTKPIVSASAHVSL